MLLIQKKAATLPVVKMRINDAYPVGLLSDLHAEHESLAHVLHYLRTQGVRDILCAGDLVDGHGCVETCIELLIREQVITVRGNHDRWLLEGKHRYRLGATLWEALSSSARQYLMTLPTTLDLETSTGQWLLCHGLGGNDMTRFIPDRGLLERFIDTRRYQGIIHGHTHQWRFQTFSELCLINPGTLRRDLQPGFAILDLGKKQLAFYTLEPAARILEQEILSVRLPRARRGFFASFPLGYQFWRRGQSNRSKIL